jgi:glutaminyl-peptide cyclotransferase
MAVLRSRCRVLGSGFWFQVLAAAAMLTAACAAMPDAQSQKPQAGFDSARAYQHLREIVSIGPRPAGSSGLARTREYIVEQLKAAGVPVQQQAFVATTPVGDISMVNLVATIPGARKERIAITGHYDTKLFREFRFVGANDGGSSAAFLIEIARVLKARTNTFTIELIFFDGEEATLRDWGGTDHTYGSQHYVDAARKAGTLPSLKAMVLVDMIADRSPRFMRESNSTPWLTDIIWSTAQKMGHGAVFPNASIPIEDDHMPFIHAGVSATDIIDLDYPAWHTPADTLDQTSARTMQVVGDVLVGSLGAIEARLSK